MLRPDRTQAVVHGFDEAGPSPNHDTEFGRRAKRLLQPDSPSGTALSLPRLKAGASRGLLVNGKDVRRSPTLRQLPDTAPVVAVAAAIPERPSPSMALAA